MRERTNLRHHVFGNHKPTSVQAQVAQWQQRAEAAHRDLVAIEALPLAVAAQLVRAQQEEQAQREATERALAERKSRAAQLHDYTRRPFERGLGL